MVVTNFIEKLKEIGMSEYEARAYLSLLESNPATAYEVARSAELPTSKIYQVIDKLTARGMVQTIMEGRKKRFVPLAAKEFIQGQRSRLQSTLDSLEQEIDRIHQNPAVSFMWNIREYLYFLEKAADCIARARKEILISAWDREILHLSGAIDRAGSSGVRAAAVIFGSGKLETAAIFRHPIEDTIHHEKGGRGFTLVVDSREAINGTIINERRVEGAWSTDRGFVIMAEDYIKHDIYIMKIVSRFDDLLTRRFGDNYHMLRDIFTDREATDGK